MPDIGSNEGVGGGGGGGWTVIVGTGGGGVCCCGACADIIEPMGVAVGPPKCEIVVDMPW